MLENLGTTLENLLNLTNLVIFNSGALNYETISNFINLLNIWPTDKQFSATMNSVLFAVYSNDNYLDTLKEVYNTTPYFHAFDYLHLFYLKQVMYKSFLSMYAASLLVTNKPIVISLHLDLFISFIFTKWGYAFACFGLTYFFSHILRVRYQYGFNFYFNYFKTLSDLGEQEYGSYDDFKFFLFILVQMLVWYCWVFFIGYTFSLQSQSVLMLLTVSVMITILTIPVRLLWDFGLAFGMYVRGAASSTNLVVEAFFDIIGVIIIFTRFVVQNIRFLMVFVAFFELFEWTSGSLELSYILQFNLNIYNSIDFFATVTPTSLFVFVVCSLKVCFIYIYHLLHLIIVSFMQIGVYLMVSFWLFFFLYTSFFKMTTDNYFSAKRNISVCEHVQFFIPWNKFLYTFGKLYSLLTTDFRIFFFYFINFIYHHIVISQVRG